MHIYLAGGGLSHEHERQLSKISKERLISYHYFNAKLFRTYYRIKKLDPAYMLFLDSGAYSSHTKGIEINLDEYMKFLHTYGRHYELYANLDVIYDEVGTIKNQHIMEENGLSPLPCFHSGEPWHMLEEYVEKYDYIALGGMVGGSKKQLCSFLDQCFDIICNEDGTPKIKIHGFGITSLPLLQMYPWFSVDSTAWIMTAAMGTIIVPKYGDYTQQPFKVTVSAKSPTKGQAGKHIDTFSPRQRKVITDYTDSLGYTLEELGSSHVPRGFTNAHYYKGLQKQLTDNPPVHVRQNRLF